MPRKLDPVMRGFNKVHQSIFRRTRGRIGASMGGTKIVGLTTIGRKSGARRTSMVGAPIIEDDMVVVVASYMAGPTHPQWYLNLLANPKVEVTIKKETRPYLAREADGPELDDLKQRIAAASWMAKYTDRAEARVDRRFPVIVLEPAP